MLSGFVPAEAEGFEPPVRSHGRLFSRQLRSTTLPGLLLLQKPPLWFRLASANIRRVLKFAKLFEKNFQKLSKKNQKAVLKKQLKIPLFCIVLIIRNLSKKLSFYRLINIAKISSKSIIVQTKTNEEKIRHRKAGIIDWNFELHSIWFYQ